MALFPMNCVLRGFSRACPVECEAYSTGATYFMYASAENPCLSRHSPELAEGRRRMRPCSSKKLLISELETNYKHLLNNF
jgi:hypothetical protein